MQSYAWLLIALWAIGGLLWFPFWTPELLKDKQMHIEKCTKRLHRMESIWAMPQMSRECMFLSSLSHDNKDLEQRTLKPSAHHSSRVLDKPCYSSQANQCYSSILFRRQQDREREGERQGVRERKRERKERTQAGERVREKRFGSSFYMFFPPPGPALCKLGLARSAVCSA